MRERIRYHARWVRLLCCSAVAVGLFDAMHSQVFDTLERLLADYLLYPGAYDFAHAPRGVEVALVALLCLLPAWPRFERPLLMVLCSSAYLLAYIVGAILTVFFLAVAPPLVTPLLALLGTTSLLETMAWSEERQQRRRLERMENARQQFIDMLVHDLRKRMSSLLMTVRLLEQRAPATGGGGAELLTTLKATGERMVILIDNLLDIRKVEEGRLVARYERVALAAFLEDGLAEHQAAADLLGLRLETDWASDAAVRADRRLLGRILTNLLWNAMQHAPTGSAVVVAFTATPAGVELRISNRGRTLTPDEQAHRFHPFASSAAGSDALSATDGAGLGLAFCRLAVAAQGGAIALVSPWPAAGEGVQVCVRLPAWPDPV